MEYRHGKNKIVIDNRASAVLYRFLISLPKGGKFILPVNICPIVSEVFEAAQKIVEFVDIDPETLCADEMAILQLIEKEKYQGILLNHTYGVESNFSSFIAKIKLQNDLIIIEDKCLCTPNLDVNEDVDLTLFSTGYAKIIELDYGGGYGIIKNDFVLAERRAESLDLGVKYGVLMLNDFDIDVKKYFDDIKSYQEKIILHKQKINAIYQSHLSSVALEKKFNDWRYNILVKDKSVFLSQIFEAGLFASSHYEPLNEDKRKYPNASRLYENVVNLFNDFHFTEKQAEKVSEIVSELLENSL
jgi:dTDP-4-amino-4,6-dideoxygalactose transaminase